MKKIRNNSTNSWHTKSVCYNECITKTYKKYFLVMHLENWIYQVFNFCKCLCSCAQRWTDKHLFIKLYRRRDSYGKIQQAKISYEQGWTSSVRAYAQNRGADGAYFRHRRKQAASTDGWRWTGVYPERQSASDFRPSDLGLLQPRQDPGKGRRRVLIWRSAREKSKTSETAKEF